MTHKRTFLYLFFLFLFWDLSAKTIYVNRTATTGLKNGTSWKDAFLQVRLAMQTAEYGDEIWVAQGMYNTYRIGGFIMKSGVRLYGGFVGGETHRQNRKWEENKTILTIFDATTGGSIFSDTVFFLPSCILPIPTKRLCWTASLFTRGLRHSPRRTLRRGLARQGGGILIFSESPENPASVTIQNCAFLSNAVNVAGGGIAVNYAFGPGTAIVKNCRFERNQGGWPGGGAGMDIRHYAKGESYILIDSCRFLNNNANSISGALSVSNSENTLTLIIQNTLFEKNKAARNGAVDVSNSASKYVIFRRCSFIDNETIAPKVEKGRGGALFALGCRVEECLFRGNKAYDAGAVWMDGVELYNNVFYNNSAIDEGGVFYSMNIWGKRNLIVGNTIVNNSTRGKGAVIYQADSRDTFLNNIIWNNRSATPYGMFEGFAGRLYVDYCAIDLPDCAVIRPYYTISLDTVSCGDSVFYHFVPDFRDTAAGDFRLRNCSPMLNRGSASWANWLNIERDYTGGPRILQERPALGAYETEYALPAPVLRSRSATNATAADGSAEVFFTDSGVPPYRYLWSNGQTGEQISGLLPGLYTVSVTDHYGCRGEASVRIDATSSAGTGPGAGHDGYLLLPNPAAGRFWVSSTAPVHSVRLYSIHGALLRHYATPDPTAGMETGGLAGGLYRVAIETADGGVVWRSLAVVR